MTLPEALASPVDGDVAMHAIATCLGMVTGSVRDNKAVYWSKNRLGTALAGILFVLVDAGYVVWDEDVDTYRWNTEESASA